MDWRSPLFWILCATPASAQLFTNLQAFGNRVAAGDPAVRATNSLDGPKGIASADFTGDGKDDIAVANTDGTVTLFYGLGEGKFAPPIHLQTGVDELRGIVAVDFTGDGRPDIAVAAPYAGKVFLFVNQGGAFGTPVSLTTWPGARNLAAGDFDGDGRMDLIVAGTTNGLRQMRGTGGGNFVTVTNLSILAAFNSDFPKPVYSLGAFRPPGATRDELIVTHADSTLVRVLAADSSGAAARGLLPAAPHAVVRSDTASRCAKQPPRAMTTTLPLSMETSSSRRPAPGSCAPCMRL